MYSNLIFINNTKWHIKTFHRLHHQLKKKMNISKVPQSYMGRMGRKYILFLCYKDLFELKPLNVISGNVVRKNRVPIYYVKKKKKKIVFPLPGFGSRFVNRRRGRNLGHFEKCRSQERRSVSNPFCSWKLTDSHLLQKGTDVCACLTS